MQTQSLNGKWNYRIGKGEWSTREVPFSARPVGHSECERSFDLEYMSERIFLVFDGITYYARVSLNGKFIGEMLPYCEYRFDITDSVTEKDNELLVELEDLSPEFGPSAGWENFGGIIRPVKIEYLPKEYIDNVFFHCELKNGYTDAEYTVEVTTVPANIEYTAELSFKGVIADSFTASGNACRSVKNVHLWSPDKPNLYDLTVRTNAYEYTCKVGFRELKCDRHRFILNGEPLFLFGVNRHEIIGDLGHTVTPELIEKDFLIAKDLGCNFIRLAHYPHCKATLEIADRMGILVSEEPGLWWSDTSNPAVSAGSLEVLRRTILRDRNHPSVAFWLSFNECEFTEQFLIDSARVARENDPYRLVSGANCMSDDDTLKYYNICGFDFYTMHPYSDTFARAAASAEKLTDKPLMFTEWGGYDMTDNPGVLTKFIEKMYALYQKNSDEGALAGAAFWYFAAVNDFNRGRPACIDGMLNESLLTADRKPTAIFDAFKNAFAKVKKGSNYDDEFYFEKLSDISGVALKCANEDNDYQRLLADAHIKEPFRLQRMRPYKLTRGPILRDKIDGLYTEPRVLFDGRELVFNGNAVGDTVTLVGAVSVKKGYPILGEYGETAAEITVVSTDGSTEVFTMKNGVDFTTVFTTLSSSIIDPIAENTERYAVFGYDRNHENYVINKLTLRLAKASEIDSIHIRSAGAGYDLMFYGVLVQ